MGVPGTRCVRGNLCRLLLMLFWSGPLGASCSAPAPCSPSNPQDPAGWWRWGLEWGGGGGTRANRFRTRLVLGVAVFGQARCNYHSGHTRTHCYAGGVISTQRHWSQRPRGPRPRLPGAEGVEHLRRCTQHMDCPLPGDWNPVTG